MFLIGLTGGISSGKSLVSSIVEELGVPVVDADLIARQIVEAGEPAYKKILKEFGPEVFKENGEIDRVKLGAVIFTDAGKRKILNTITHPYIYGEIKKQVFRHFIKGEQFVVLDLPLMFETRSVLPYIYKTIVVTCDDEIQLQRLMARNLYSKAEAKNRIEAQMPLELKTTLADFVIENSGSIANTRNQVEGIIKFLRSSKRHIRNRVIGVGGLIVAIVIIIYICGYLSRFVY